MASLLSYKRRIKTAQNVSKTTKALQMISASKLKKAQTATLNARPYVDKLTTVSRSISQNIVPEKLNDYMKTLSNEEHKLLIIISPDKGLCGGLVTNLGRELITFTRDNKKASYIAMGKKANTLLNIIGAQNTAFFDFGTTLPSYEMVFPVMSIIDDYFLNKKVSEVYILNSNFNNVFSQTPVIKKLLPVSFETDIKSSSQLLFEPKADEILPGLIRHYLEISVYQALLESYLSEQAARMIAMQNATDNAKDIIEELRLLYNKTRQEKITNEILDISGGAFLNA
jgi:F-type H+-transporting ATPase subunit gamma